jgi:hypothetical protein
MEGGESPRTPVKSTTQPPASPDTPTKPPRSRANVLEENSHLEEELARALRAIEKMTPVFNEFKALSDWCAGAADGESSAVPPLTQPLVKRVAEYIQALQIRRVAIDDAVRLLRPWGSKRARDAVSDANQ